MKKIIIIFFIFFSNINQLVLRDFENTYKNSNNEIVISVDMLNKYVLKLKKQLENFKIKYYIKQDDKIDWKINELQKLSIILKKIQNEEKDISLIKNVIKIVISNLKNIDSEIKPYLQEKINGEQKLIMDFKINNKQKFKDIWNKIKNNSNEIKEKINSKKFLTEKNKKTLLYLDNLSNYWNNIKKIYKTDFNTLYDLKLYLKNNIKSILHEIQKIKQL